MCLFSSYKDDFLIKFNSKILFSLDSSIVSPEGDKRKQDGEKPTYYLWYKSVKLYASAGDLRTRPEKSFGATIARTHQ